MPRLPTTPRALRDDGRDTAHPWIESACLPAALVTVWYARTCLGARIKMSPRRRVARTATRTHLGLRDASAPGGPPARSPLARPRRHRPASPGAHRTTLARSVRTRRRWRDGGAPGRRASAHPGTRPAATRPPSDPGYPG